jgi:hypothetical protein
MLEVVVVFSFKKLILWGDRCAYIEAIMPYEWPATARLLGSFVVCRLHLGPWVQVLAKTDTGVEQIEVMPDGSWTFKSKTEKSEEIEVDD